MTKEFQITKHEGTFDIAGGPTAPRTVLDQCDCVAIAGIERRSARSTLRAKRSPFVIRALSFIRHFRPAGFLIPAATFFAFVALSVTTAAASAGTTHIAAYGDSGVAGKGVAPNESYPAQLERMLRAKGHDVTVTNLGVNGRTSQDAVANLDTIPRNTDVVIVQFGINDVKHGLSVADVQKNIDTVVARLRDRAAGVLVIGSGTVDLSQVAARHGALYVKWGGLPEPKYHVPDDPNGHFNSAGLHVMAERMLPAIEKLLAK